MNMAMANGKNSNRNIVVKNMDMNQTKTNCKNVALAVLNMNMYKANDKNSNGKYVGDNDHFEYKNVSKNKTKANGKNSNGNDENVGGIDHESNGSNGNIVVLNKARVNVKNVQKTSM